MKKIKKILIFYPSYENGGATKNLQNLITFFTYQNIHVKLITGNARYSNFIYKKNKFEIVKPKKIISLFFFQRVNYSFSVLKLFFKNVKLINSKDTVILSMQSHLLSVLSCKLLNKKIIMRNSEDPFGATKYADEKFLSILVFLSKFISFNFSDGIITNSKKSFESIKFFLLNKDKVNLIFNPYLNKINKIKKNNHKKNHILAVGRFSKQKNFSFLIDTFRDFHKKFKDYKLIIIGSGQKKGEIINQINLLKIKNKVEILSWKENLEQHFRKSKFFVLPSLYEGLPNILIDAINNGIPCIASKCSGSMDILKNNKSGLIFDINDKNQLLRLMYKMHYNYNFYNKNAVKFVDKSDRFLIKPQAKKYLNFFYKIVNN